MPGRDRLRKLKSRRVLHKSTGGVLPRTPQPVDPVGNPPPPSPLNTVAHLPAAAPAGLLSRKITGEVLEAATTVNNGRGIKNQSGNRFRRYGISSRVEKPTVR